MLWVKSLRRIGTLTQISMANLHKAGAVGAYLEYALRAMCWRFGAVWMEVALSRYLKGRNLLSKMAMQLREALARLFIRAISKAVLIGKENSIRGWSPIGSFMETKPSYSPTVLPEAHDLL